MNEFYYYLIKGYFDWASFYDKIVNEASDGDDFIEIGILHGKSTIYLANKVKESKKDIHITAIDPFRKNYNGQKYSLLETKKNFRMCNVSNHIKLISNYSLKVVNKFKDESIFMIMLDGDHSYDNVYKEITDYYPKVKQGGYIATHNAINVKDSDIYCNGPFNAMFDFCHQNRIDNHLLFNFSRENRGCSISYLQKI